MIAFCPTCGNMLLVEHCSDTAGLRYFCQTCPYVFDIEHTMRQCAKLKRKEVADIFDDAKMWETAQRTEHANCPNCQGHVAYFYEMQTRSADEPATVFYRCASERCKKVWSEN